MGMDDFWGTPKTSKTSECFCSTKKPGHGFTAFGDLSTSLGANDALAKALLGAVLASLGQDGMDGMHQVKDR